MPISLVCGGEAMGVVAVQFDDEALVAPERIDGQAADCRVGLRQRQPDVLTEDKEALLEDAERGREFGQVGVKRPAQCSRAVSAPPESPFNFPRRKKTLVVGLREGAAELRVRKDGGDVEEGPGDGCDREAAVAGYFRPPRVMDANSRQ